MQIEALRKQNVGVTKTTTMLLHSLTLVALALGIAPAAAKADDAYLLEPGDVLQISVWEEPDLMHELLIRPDGRLSFPLVGEVEAAGRSVAEIDELITERLRPYIAEPAVNVTVLLTNGSRIYVVGRVNRPGVFPLDGELDVLHALTLAGGLAEFADVKNIRIIRRTEGGHVAIEFNYEDMTRGKRLAQNIALEPGDTVVVP